MTAGLAQERFDVASPDGTVIPVFRSGSGPPLVTVHGGIGDHTSWDKVRPFLEPRVTIYAIDRRNGFFDPAVRYDLAREFEDVAAVARAIGGPVSLLGSSSGALCVMGAATLLADLSKLVLYEPPMVAGWPVTPGLSERVQAGDNEGAAEIMLRDVLKLSPEAITARKASPAWERDVARIAYFVREEAVVQAWEPDRTALGTVKAPILLLVGGDTPRGHHHRGYVEVLRSAGVDLTVREIAGQEHFAHAQVPDLFANLVIEFLEG